MDSGLTKGWSLHPQLAPDTVPVGDLPLPRVLLANDANYPWLILVPRLPGLVELIDLEENAQVQLARRDRRGRARAENASPRCDKLNIAALGNLVPQLHVHVIARRRTDAAWPKPVWGVKPPLAYSGRSTGKPARFIASVSLNPADFRDGPVASGLRKNIMAANPSRILVISLRRIGDLLLTTPLIRSLRRAWPDAEIDVLVFANTAGILAGNPDINRVISHAAAADDGGERPPLARGSGGSTISRCRRRAVIAPPLLPLPLLRLRAGVIDRRRPMARARAEGASSCSEASRPRTSFIASSRCCASPTSSKSRASQNWSAPRPAPTSNIVDRQQFCLDPCNADVRLQGMDTGRMESARRRPRRTRSSDCRNWRTRAKPSGAISTHVWHGVTTVHQVEWPEMMHLLSSERASISDPIHR